ncbi:hypothetical protein ABTZ99_07515 [Actinosynnema sp. NPDC002837]
MALDWGYFRWLYEALHDEDDVDARRRFLSGERRAVADHLAGLAPLRTRERIPAGGYTVDDEQLWLMLELYALSRVSDHLIALHGEVGVTGGRAVVEGGVGRIRTCPPAHAVHTEFFTAVGLTPFGHVEAFSPFHHEIVAVVQDPSATSVTVEEVLWPGFWFGDLLFSRAGVRVRAPRHLIDATVATTSVLYFTFRRGQRPTNDLSHGWGSQSQWRTSFPRFYSDEEGLHLNWDGEVDIGADPPVPAGDGPDDDVPLDQRRELLLHRCFVRGDPPRDADDRFPYVDRLSLTTAQWPLRPEAVTHVPWSR